MSVEDFKYTPEDGLSNATEFPATPNNQTEARGQFMALFNQIKDFLNTKFISKFNAHTAETVTQGNPHGVDAKANKQQESWIQATLQNGWAGGPLYYRKNELGNVEFRGNIGSGAGGNVTIGTVLFQLPVGYRPNYDIRLSVTTWDIITNTSKAIVIGINTSGVATIMGSDSLANISLHGQFFPIN